MNFLLLIFISLGLLVVGATIPRVILIPIFGILFSIALLIYYFPEILPFSSVALSTLLILVGYVARILITDVISIIYQSGIFTFLRSASWSLLYTSPILIILWLANDIQDWRERALFYGCPAGNILSNVTWIDYDAKGIYNIKRSQSDILYGRKEGNQRYLLDFQEHTDGLFDGLISYFPKLVRDPLTSISLSGLNCPPPKMEANHKESAIETVNAYADRLRVVLEKRVEEVLATGEDGVGQGNTAALRILFGPDADWHNGTRGPVDGDGIIICPPDAIIPGNLECSPNGLGRIASCSGWLLTPASCMQRRIQKPIYDTYHERRDAFERDTRNLSGNLAQAGETGAATVRRITQRFVNTEIEIARKKAVFTIEKLFFYWSVLLWAIFVVTFMVVMKVFLHLLGRFLFSQNPRGGQVEISLTSEASEHSKLGTKVLSPSDDRKFVIPTEEGTVWYAFWRSGIGWQRPEAGKHFFRPSQCYLRRLVYGKGKVSVYKNAPPTGSVPVTTGLRLMKINKDQQVIVDLKYVAAISEGVSFRTVFVPRLSAFLQRGLFYTELNGEGKVLLSCDGGESVDTDTDAAPHRIIAMDRLGSYSCHAPLKGLDPYWHPFTIGPTNNTTMITFAPIEDGGGTGIKSIGRLLRNTLFFVLPF